MNKGMSLFFRHAHSDEMKRTQNHVLFALTDIFIGTENRIRRGYGHELQRYAFKKVSRSELMVSASVVGMPCGKPL